MIREFKGYHGLGGISSRCNSVEKFNSDELSILGLHQEHQIGTLKEIMW